MIPRIWPRVFVPARLNLRTIQTPARRRNLCVSSCYHLYFARVTTSSRIKSRARFGQRAALPQDGLSLPADSLSAVLQLRCAGRACAVDTAEDFSVRFHAVTNDTAIAMRTNRRERVNCALETVEDVSLSAHNNFERFVIIVFANFACRHTESVRVWCGWRRCLFCRCLFLQRRDHE